MAREPIQLIELDLDRCTRTFGVGLCTAALGPATPRKCYNTFATCAAKAAYNPAPFTLRFAEARANLKTGDTIFPCLKSVSGVTNTVNIAGTDDTLGPTGRRATVTARFDNIPHHDRGLDPYVDERKSGAAQIDEGPYDPATRGTLFGKLNARDPHYAGRPARWLEGDLEGGNLTIHKTRNFVIYGREVSADGQEVSFEFKDVLALAEDDKALVPAPSNGVLSADLSSVGTSATLEPAGVGAEYELAGRVNIGGEICSFTRAGDVLTLTARGLSGSKNGDHKKGDTVQTVLRFDGVQVHDYYETILRLAKVPSAFVPYAAWASEVARWMPSVRIETDIATPTGAAKLIGEASILGPSIWWNDETQTIGFRANRPAIEGARRLTARDDIKKITLEDQDDKRLTEVYFYSVQIDATKSATSADNFRRTSIRPDLEAKSPFAYGDTKVRRIFCRLFNSGADGIISGITKRLLNRFRVAPQRARIVLDARLDDLQLAEVIEVEADVFEDATGKSVPRLMQVISKSFPKAGHDIEIIAQAYDFAGRYAVATETSRPIYSLSSDAQKRVGFYAVDHATMLFPDGTGPYVAS